MTAQLSFFPVGNRDMTLVQTDAARLYVVALVHRNVSRCGPSTGLSGKVRHDRIRPSARSHTLLPA